MLKYITSALILVLALGTGCSDRGENTAPVYQANGGPWVVEGGGHVFFPELLTQIRNKSTQMLYIKGWVPNVEEWTTNVGYVPQEKLPLLILLPPEEGDDYYYFHHGLMEVANELMTEGLMEPMAIFIPRNDPVYGGYWWASPYGRHPDYDTVASASGNYDDLVGESLIDWIFSTALGHQRPFDESQGMTGIGGIGTGAYGAVRAALLRPDRFGSVSAINGPLDFDGIDGQSGLIPLFPKAIAEQAAEPFEGAWDTSSTNPISRLFTGGAFAFSPHDTLVLPQVDSTLLGARIRCPDSIPLRIDTISYPPLVADTTWEQRRWKIQGTETLLDSITGEGEFYFWAHLPFNRFGRPYSTPDEPIWDMWLKNSPDRMLARAEWQYGRVFENTDLWVAYSQEEDPLGYNVMTMAFAKTLKDKFGYDPEVYFFRGYEDNPAWGDEYLTHLLREMLIFHSNSFRRAREAQQNGD